MKKINIGANKHPQHPHPGRGRQEYLA